MEIHVGSERPGWIDTSPLSFLLQQQQKQAVFLSRREVRSSRGRGDGTPSLITQPAAAAWTEAVLHTKQDEIKKQFLEEHAGQNQYPVRPSGWRLQNKQTQTREIHTRAGEALFLPLIVFLLFPNELMIAFASCTLFCCVLSLNSVVHINQTQSSLSQQLLLRFPHFSSIRPFLPSAHPSAAPLGGSSVEGSCWWN